MSFEVSGKLVVVTGTFAEQRSVLESKLAGLGAKSGVSSKTNVLFAGEKAGSKLAKAEELGIPIYGEAQTSFARVSLTADAGPSNRGGTNRLSRPSDPPPVVLCQRTL